MEDIVEPYLWLFEEEGQVFGNSGEEEKESCVQQLREMSGDGHSCSTTPLKSGGGRRVFAVALYLCIINVVSQISAVIDIYAHVCSSSNSDCRIIVLFLQ